MASLHYTTDIVFWKIYFWVLAALLFVGEGTMFADGLTVPELGAIVLEVAVVVGFFGFAYRKKVVTPSFWRLAILLYLVVSVLLALQAVYMDQLDPKLVVAGTLMGIVLELPMIIALFLYSSRKHPVWSAV